MMQSYGSSEEKSLQIPKHIELDEYAVERRMCLRGMLTFRATLAISLLMSSPDADAPTTTTR